MQERPILFSGPLVRSILSGAKTQTRRLVKPQPEIRSDGRLWWTISKFHEAARDDGGIPEIRCPFGAPGDRLYVRENWRPWIRGWSSHVQYQADGWRGDSLDSKASHAAMEWCSTRGGHWDDGRLRNPDDARWFPSIHMPRWASRLTLEVTSVRVERLQDISEEDARAEGITDGGCLNCGESESCGCPNPQPSARDSFVRLWDSLAPEGSRWVDSPYVWVVDFKRLP